MAEKLFDKRLKYQFLRVAIGNDEVGSSILPRGTSLNHLLALWAHI